MPRKRLARREMKVEPDETSQPVATRRSMITHSGSEQDVALDQGRCCHLCEGDKYVYRSNGCRVRFCIPCMQGQVARIGHDCLCSGIGASRDIVDLSLVRLAIDLGYTGQATSVSRRAISALRSTRRWQRSEWVQWVASFRYRLLAGTLLRHWHDYVESGPLLQSSETQGGSDTSSESGSSSAESERSYYNGSAFSLRTLHILSQVL